LGSRVTHTSLDSRGMGGRVRRGKKGIDFRLFREGKRTNSGGVNTGKKKRHSRKQAMALSRVPSQRRKRERRDNRSHTLSVVREGERG